ncbi:hypothetical protein [Rhodococcus sp. IEGM 1408]|uniref:hypothetical protein n=1 Tax=Rhodococcus sp. IEGM 1408 TaxID=3082220 RepID=UPI0029557266|nr:hypothetical protein [Rhodococcus sp. IEGM 1408]MDV8001378.1 hypothetical protein [Rhodococcus sp. IEGM 1408]
MPLILALLLLAVIAGLVVWIAATGWLVRSGLEDLARRRRLRRGTDPVQLTAERAVDSARRSYLLALEALTETVDRWFGLRATLGIGTPLEDEYLDIRDRTDADPEFAGLLERANSACLDNRSRHPDTVADLLGEAARMDSLTLAIRGHVHRAGRSPRRGLDGGSAG